MKKKRGSLGCRIQKFRDWDLGFSIFESDKEDEEEGVGRYRGTSLINKYAPPP